MASAMETHDDHSSSNGEKQTESPSPTAQKHHSHIHTIDNLPDPDAHLNDEERAAADKKLLQKLDRKLIPWLSFLYRT